MHKLHTEKNCFLDGFRLLPEIKISASELIRPTYYMEKDIEGKDLNAQITYGKKLLFGWIPFAPRDQNFCL